MFEVPSVDIIRHELYAPSQRWQQERAIYDVIGANVTIYTHSIPLLQKHRNLMTDVLRKAGITWLSTFRPAKRLEKAAYYLKKGSFGRYKLEKLEY